MALISGEAAVPFSGWTAAAVLAGVGQVLAGSLAYLVPVLAGPPLGDNLRRLTAHGWIPLATANLAGMALVARLAPAALVLIGVWLTDFARRLVSIALSRSGGRHPRD